MVDEPAPVAASAGEHGDGVVADLELFSPVSISRVPQAFRSTGSPVAQALDEFALFRLRLRRARSSHLRDFSEAL